MGAEVKEIGRERGGQNLLAFEDLARRIAKYLPEADLNLVDKAYRFSRLAHEGQRRRSGEEYIQHPLAVAFILAEMELDLITLAAALLHDVVEDTGVTLEHIEAEFGADVARLVDGVTKLGRLQYRTRMEEQAENLRKMFLAMAQDIRVIIIKLADRLHNMRTLACLPEAKQREIAQETMDIFAPLAHRLGIFRFKWELEDLSFRYLEPETYHDLARRIPNKRQEREQEAEGLMETLRQRLQEAGIRADIQGRAKHLFSIYGKIHKGKDLAEMYDLLAVRVIVDSIKDCYGVLGVVHALWKPLPGRFKDYIATPKSNMYQSLHTTVIGPQGEPFEIQIRTWDMHRTSEYGIAAHWRYKEGGRGDKDFDQKLLWLREILEWQKDLRDAGEFMESLKIDIFTDEVFVFTPKGEVIDLPAGSTPIDFAYRIHSEVGHRCVGAKANGRIISLDTPLKNGDVVEILTSKSSPGPSADWLNIAKTGNAKNRIRQWFKRENREENQARGRDLIEREIRRQGLEPEQLLRDEWVEEVLRKLNLPTAEELMVSVGYGGISAQQVMTRLKDLYMKEQAVLAPPLPTEAKPRPRRQQGGDDGVRVKGVDHVLVRFPRCCSPVPGDEIVGYITRGRGVAIHRQGCPSLASNVREEGQGGRLIEVNWDGVDARFYPVEIAINASDRPGLLSDVARAVAETQTNILFSRTWAYGKGTAKIDLVLEVKNLDQLAGLQKRIEKVRDVFSVDRVTRQGAR